MIRFSRLGKFGRHVPRLLMTLALLGMIVYTVYHVVGSSAQGLLTTPAREITDVQILSTQAYLFRDETVLTVESGALVQSVATSGTKVSRQAELARIYAYSGDDLAARQAELDLINRHLSILEASIPPQNSTLADAQKWRAEARACYLDILRAVQSGQTVGIEQTQDEMLALLNRYQAITEDSTAVREQLAAIRAQLGTALGEHAQVIRNERSSGYFYDRTCVDGYESFFSTSALSSLTVSGFDALTATTPVVSAERTAVGKMVYGYEWYLAIRLDAPLADYFKEEGRYEMTFSDNGDRTMVLTCDRVLTEETNGAVVIFRSQDYPADFQFLRVQNVKVETDYIKGYYVPDSALQTVDGVEGVYIFENRTVRFRRVNVLWRGDGYCIVAQKGDQGEDYLNLNDILITYGKKLYDGKVY